MIKRFFLAAACLAVAGSAFAQTESSAAVADTVEYSPTVTETVEYSTEKYKVETNRFWDNWFISVGGGGQVYFGDHDKQVSFFNRIAPALDVSVGKWFSPSIGVRLMYSGLQIKGATQKFAPAHSTGEDVPDKGGWGYWLEMQKFPYFNIHADVLFNLSNIIGGYKANRFYNISGYGGLGVMHTSDEPSATDISAHVGLLNSFRLCDALDLNLDLRGTFVDDNFDGEPGGRTGEGMFTATIGVTYKFKKRDWDRSKTVTRTVDHRGEVDALRDQLKRLDDENARLQDALAEAEKEKAPAVTRQVVATNFVTFQINKSKLSNEARVNLGMFAEAVKQGDPDAVYVITGYADAGTGNQKINERLSKARAEAVYDCLVNEFGVSESQLKIDYKGGVENMFYDDPRMSRAVITKSE